MSTKERNIPERDRPLAGKRNAHESSMLSMNISKFWEDIRKVEKCSVVFFKNQVVRHFYARVHGKLNASFLALLERAIKLVQL